MDIAGFLLARIAEDEVAAITEQQLRSDDPYWTSGEASAWERRQTPDHVLADCAAKRHLVALAQRPSLGAQGFRAGVEMAFNAALRILALPHADHPDYNPEWRP